MSDLVFLRVVTVVMCVLFAATLVASFYAPIMLVGVAATIIILVTLVPVSQEVARSEARLAKIKRDYTPGRPQ